MVGFFLDLNMQFSRSMFLSHSLNLLAILNIPLFFCTITHFLHFFVYLIALFKTYLFSFSLFYLCKKLICHPLTFLLFHLSGTVTFTAFNIQFVILFHSVQFFLYFLVLAMLFPGITCQSSFRLPLQIYSFFFYFFRYLLVFLSFFCIFNLMWILQTAGLWLDLMSASGCVLANLTEFQNRSLIMMKSIWMHTLPPLLPQVYIRLGFSWYMALAMTNVFLWQNSRRLHHLSFVSPRPLPPVILGAFSFPTFAFQSRMTISISPEIFEFY